MTGRHGVAQPMKLTHMMQKKTRTPKRKSRAKKESDLTTAFEREMDELASVVEELEDTLGVQDVEDLREFSESVYERPATIKETHAKLREKTRSSHAAFGSRHTSLSHWPWKRQDET